MPLISFVKLVLTGFTVLINSESAWISGTIDRIFLAALAFRQKFTAVISAFMAHECC